MASPRMKDSEFLALLVHRGHVQAAKARQWVASLSEGASLDALLADSGFTEEEIARLRRTRAGETPEIPGYKVRKRIGVGGTSDVFQVDELKTGQTLALKVLNPKSTQHAPTRKAFIAEARLLERLDHEALVRCHGVARSGNTFFSRLEFIQGQTLLEILEERGEGLAEEEALSVIVEAAKALAYLSENGVVHRDVKPGNLMIDEATGRVVLIDLGFATSGGDSSGPAADQAIGTVAYLSPEAAAGGAAADVRSDIYSLGLSLFHLSVGKLPFETDCDDREVLRQKVMESLSSPELLRRRISPHLQYFIEKMVAHDADDRYQSYDALIRDVEAQIRGREALSIFRRR